MAGIYSQGGSAGHRYAGWLSEVEAKNFQFGGKVFNGSPSAIYVGSNLVWVKGGLLMPATMQAIRGAFGVLDGTAVINATNTYLNQLAASDRDKATALAGFINEDPMMVCSLGLQPQGVTMPIRWLVSNRTTGTSIIEIADGIGSYPVVEMRVRFNGGTSGVQTFAGTSDTVNARRFNFYVNRPYGYVADYNGNSNVIIAASSDYNGSSGLITRKLKFGDGKFYINDVQKATFTPASKTYSGGVMFIRPRPNEPLWIAWMNAISQNDTYPHHLVPFIGRTLGDGVYDFDTNQVYINSGTDKFTDAYTLQDGVTHWTPSTP